jgi:glutamate 5-kinase
MKNEIKQNQRIVIKVGTSSVTKDDGEVHRDDGRITICFGGEINREFVEKLCAVIAELQQQGHSVALVTSGAVGLGGREIQKRSAFEFDLVWNKSVCASVGQSLLMERYNREFRKHGILTGQTLLAGKADYKRDATARSLYDSMKNGIVQVINANDTVFDEQIRIGDNDTLSAEVAKIVRADKLIMVTDMDGLYKNHGAVDEELVGKVSARGIDALYKHAGGSIKSSTGLWRAKGTGGMRTKLDAAKIATGAGVDTYIMSNQSLGDIARVVNGDETVRCTHFEVQKKCGIIQFCKQAIKARLNIGR